MYSESASTCIAVSGSMRSGANLIGHLLHMGRDGARAHPELAFVKDNRRIAAFFEAVRVSCEPVAMHDDPFRIEHLTKPMLERFYGEEINNIATGLDRIRCDFLEEIYSQSAGPRCASSGFKRTSINYEIGVLQDIFPNLRLVLSVRDPRDIFLSFLRYLGHSDQSSGNVLLILAYILGNYHFIERLKLQSTKHLVIKYEDVVRDLQGQVAQLLKFIDLDIERYDSTYIMGSEQLRDSYFAGESTRTIGGFRTTIEPDITAFIEVLCAPIFAAYGYERVWPRAEWRSDYEKLIEDMYWCCAHYKISFAPVMMRLQELGLDELSANLGREWVEPGVSGFVDPGLSSNLACRSSHRSHITDRRRSTFGMRAVRSVFSDEKKALG
jgi:hypothetical protein